MAQSKEFVDASHALNDLSHALALLESENASLRGAADGLCDENAKLRELCKFMLRCMLRYHDQCDYCLVNGEYCDITYIESDAQELGIEVDE